MTKSRPPHIEPTSGTNYSIYLWPRSKNAAKQRIYDFLHDAGWRYDHNTGLFHTPETSVLQGSGRLEHDLTATEWAQIQPPSTMGPAKINGHHFDSVPLRAQPILVLDLTGPEITITT